MAAFVGIELNPHGLPAGIPHGVAVLDVKISSVVVEGYIIIAVPGQTAEPGVGMKGITARGVGYKGKEFRIPKIVDPGIRGPGSLNDILPVYIVKMSEFHSVSSK